ncbi:hypothetical protein ACE6H2_006891 [Prunus campanulata]
MDGNKLSWGPSMGREMEVSGHFLETKPQRNVGNLHVSGCWEQVPSKKYSRNQGVLAYELPEAPFGPACISTSFPSSDLAMEGEMKEEEK